MSAPPPHPPRRSLRAGWGPRQIWCEQVKVGRGQNWGGACFCSLWRCPSNTDPASTNPSHTLSPVVGFGLVWAGIYNPPCDLFAEARILMRHQTLPYNPNMSSPTRHRLDCRLG